MGVNGRGVGLGVKSPGSITSFCPICRVIYLQAIIGQDGLDLHAVGIGNRD